MANHISHARLPYPILNARFTLEYVGLDADGDPTDPTTPDTEVSQDGGAYADAAEEVTTISGSNGSGFVTLTGAETNNSLVMVCFKVASGPKATVMSLRPRNLPVLASGTASAGAAGALTLASSITYDITGCFLRTTGGTGGGGTGGANNQARRITAYNTSTQVATVTPNWETTPDATTTYDVLLPEGVTPGMLKALNPTTAGATLDVTATGEAGIDWGNVGNKTTTNALTNTTVAATQQVDVNTIKTQAVTASGGVTFPAATLASTTNITAGTLTTVTTATNLTNLPGVPANWLTAAGIAAGALNGKGDWLTSGGYTAPPSAATISATVWAEATRTLTSGANVVLAKGTGVTGFNDLSAAQVNAEADTALADVGLTATVTGRIDAAVSTRAATGAAMTLTGGERDSVAAALLDLASGVETSVTVRQALRLLAAALGGQLSGAASTTVTIKAAGTPGTTRISSVVDADGNRTAVTLNL